MSRIVKCAAVGALAAMCALAPGTSILAQGNQLGSPAPGVAPAPGGQRGQAPAAPFPGAAPAGSVIGVGTYIHLVSDANRSLAFYVELLGAQPNGNATGPREFGPNEVVSNLYGTPGSPFRGGTVRIPGTELAGAEMTDWQVGDRKRVQPRIQDAGTATLVLTVRDITTAAAALGKNGGSIVTPKGQPVMADSEGGKARMLLGRDPDGFLIGVMQFDVTPATQAPAESNIIGASLIVTVADLDKAVRLYHDALGFEVDKPTPFEKDRVLTDAAGLPASAQRRCAKALIPGTALPVEFVEFKGADSKPLGADAHGVGSSVLRLRVKDIDATMAALKANGVTVASANGQSVTFANGQRMAIMSDPNGIFVQVVQAAPPQPARGGQ